MRHCGQHSVILCMRADARVGLCVGFERLRAISCPLCLSTSIENAFYSLTAYEQTGLHFEAFYVS